MSKLNKKKIKYYLATALLVVGGVLSGSVSGLVKADGFNSNQYPLGTQYEQGSNKTGFDIGNPYFVSNIDGPSQDITMSDGHVIKAGSLHKGEIIPTSDYQYVQSINQQLTGGHMTNAIEPVWNWKANDPNATIPAGTTVKFPITGNVAFNGWLNQNHGDGTTNALTCNIMYNGHVVGTATIPADSAYGTMTFNDYFESHHMTHISGQIIGTINGGLNGTGTSYQKPATSTANDNNPSNKPNTPTTDNPGNVSGSTGNTSSSSTSSSITNGDDDDDTAPTGWPAYSGWPARKSVYSQGRYHWWTVIVNASQQTIDQLDFTDKIPDGQVLVAGPTVQQAALFEQEDDNGNDVAPDIKYNPSKDIGCTATVKNNVITIFGNDFKWTTNVPKDWASFNTNFMPGNLKWKKSTDGQTNAAFVVSYETEDKTTNRTTPINNTVKGENNVNGEPESGQATASVPVGNVNKINGIAATATGTVEQSSSSSSSSSSSKSSSSFSMNSSSSSSNKSSSSSVKSKSSSLSSKSKSLSTETSSGSSVKSSSIKSSSSSLSESSSTLKPVITKSSSTTIAHKIEHSTSTVNEKSVVATTSYEESTIVVPSTVTTPSQKVQVGSSSWSEVAGSQSTVSIESTVKKPVVVSSEVVIPSTVSVSVSESTSTNTNENTTTQATQQTSSKVQKTSSKIVKQHVGVINHISSQNSSQAKLGQNNVTEVTNKITGTQAENVQQKANSARIAKTAKGLPQTGETARHVLQAIGITLMFMGALIFADTKFKKD